MKIKIGNDKMSAEITPDAVAPTIQTVPNILQHVQSLRIQNRSWQAMIDKNNAEIEFYINNGVAIPDDNTQPSPPVVIEP